MLLRSWALDRAFSQCFRDMQADGYFLAALLETDPASEPAARCGAATGIHWAKLRALLEDEWKVDPAAAVSTAAAAAAATTTAATAAAAAAESSGGLHRSDGRVGVGSGGARRQLALGLDGFSGVRIIQDKATIQMGAEGDVIISRSGPSAVTIDASVNITGSLFVNGVGHLQCAGVDLSGVVGRFNGTTAVADGDYVDTGLIHCDDGFYALSKRRWRCTEGGGMAVPTGDLCAPFVCGSVDTSSNGALLLHGGTYYGRAKVASGERLDDTGRVGNCTGKEAASEADGLTM